MAYTKGVEVKHNHDVRLLRQTGERELNATSARGAYLPHAAGQGGVKTPFEWCNVREVYSETWTAVPDTPNFDIVVCNYSINRRTAVTEVTTLSQPPKHNTNHHHYNSSH